MIVVGCRGRGALRRRLLGSVSSGLVHHAHCPVAVIHDWGHLPRAGEDPLMPHPARAPVVVGIDGSPASESATAIAFDEASRRKVELVAVYAFSDIDVSDIPCVERSTMQLLGEQVLVKRLNRGRSAIPTSRCVTSLSLMRRLTSWSSSRSPPSSSSWAVMAAGDSPACCRLGQRGGGSVCSHAGDRRPPFMTTREHSPIRRWRSILTVRR